MTPESTTYGPLLAALRANLSPAGLGGFLAYAQAVIAAETGAEDDDDGLGPPPDGGDETPLGPEPDIQHDAPARTVLPFRCTPDVPEIGPDSETDDVVAWCRANHVQASVVGRWVWVDLFQQQLAHDRDELAIALKAAGFRHSQRRQAWFHDCTIPCKHPLDRNRRPGTGKLERFHNVVNVQAYTSGMDPRPAWQQAKTRKKRGKAS